MKTGQFTDERIVGILRQADAAAGTKRVRDICRENNITETTFYRCECTPACMWRKRFGSMDASEAAKTRELDRENARLKRLLVHARVNSRSATLRWTC